MGRLTSHRTSLTSGLYWHTQECSQRPPHPWSRDRCSLVSGQERSCPVLRTWTGLESGSRPAFHLKGNSNEFVAQQRETGGQIRDLFPDLLCEETERGFCQILIQCPCPGVLRSGGPSAGWGSSGRHVCWGAPQFIQPPDGHPDGHTGNSGGLANRIVNLANISLMYPVDSECASLPS